MQLKNERIGRSTNEAYATPWEVCFDVAYPPSSMLKNNNFSQRTMLGVSAMTLRAFAFI